MADIKISKSRTVILNFSALEIFIMDRDKANKAVLLITQIKVMINIAVAAWVFHPQVM